MATTVIPFRRGPVTEALPAVSDSPLMPPCDARTAHLCPACDSELSYERGQGVCRSKMCLYRVVLAGSDV